MYYKKTFTERISDEAIEELFDAGHLRFIVNEDGLDIEITEERFARYLKETGKSPITPARPDDGIRTVWRFSGCFLFCYVSVCLFILIYK